MSSSTASLAPRMSPKERVEVLFEELAELSGQRNVLDARVVEIVAELDGDGLWGLTGVRSIASLVAWKTGVAPRNAETIVAIARRAEEFPACVAAMREGPVVGGSGGGDRRARR